LDRAKGSSNEEIERVFNEYFQGVAKINVNQVKYIRTTYGRDPRWL